MVSIAEIANFVADPDECDPQLHQAAYTGDYDTLEKLLADTQWVERINVQCRPFGATPLRFASTGGHIACVKLLLLKGADVNMADYKAQTSLFVAIKNHHLQTAEILLQAGADANGTIKNRCSPLYVACQSGFVEGVKLLLSHGAKVEQIERLTGDTPGHPAHIAIVYGHLPCLIELLMKGAEINFSRISPPLPDFVLARLSLAHTIISHQRSIIFAKLFHIFGGNLWQRDVANRLPTELPINCESKEYLAQAMEQPLQLTYLCRNIIRLAYHRYFHEVSNLNLPQAIVHFLLYRDIL